MTLNQTLTAIGPNLTSSFQGVNGTTPYAYSVRPGGAGGSIDAASGLYTAPGSVSVDPLKFYDTVQVKDSLGAIAISKILIGTPLMLFCEVIENQLGLANGRVYLYDQKIFQPTDSSLYIAVNVLSCKPFSNTNVFDANGNSIQSVNMYAMLQLDVISRSTEALNRKEEVIMAFNSNYAESQQEANSFYIGKLPPGAQFLNLSSPDGAAIPYRFNINVALQYFVTKTQAVPYYDTFQDPAVTTEA